MLKNRGSDKKNGFSYLKNHIFHVFVFTTV